MSRTKQAVFANCAHALSGHFLVWS